MRRCIFLACKNVNPLCFSTTQATTISVQNRESKPDFLRVVITSFVKPTTEALTIVAINLVFDTFLWLSEVSWENGKRSKSYYFQADKDSILRTRSIENAQDGPATTIKNAEKVQHEGKFTSVCSFLSCTVFDHSWRLEVDLSGSLQLFTVPFLCSILAVLPFTCRTELPLFPGPVL